jgi:parallel beta-helix repeat protein
MIKKLFIFSTVLIIIIIVFLKINPILATASIQFNNQSNQRFVPGEFIVKFKGSVSVPKTMGITGVQSIDRLNKNFGVISVKKVFKTNTNFLQKIYKFTVPINSDILAIVKEYKNNPLVEYAEPNYIYHTTATPNDSSFSSQWPHQNMQSELAWNITQGNESVIIAIIDTGVDWDHPDLADNMWNNTDEVEDGNDTDANGYIDDIRGWDFVDTTNPGCTDTDCTTRDNNPMDFNKHGTHCSGIAAAVTNNSIGIAGTCWNCKIMAVRAGYDCSPYGCLDNDDSAAAIEYAADNNASIISMSWGGYSSSSLIQDAINYAYTRGVVLVAAAGNDNTDSKLYPAAYDKVIAISATDSGDQKASFSNYGSWVDVSAPGVSIYSTVWNDTYASYQGTSMAAPFVAGLAGLILSKNSSFNQEEIKTILHSTTDNVSSSQYIGIGRINAYKAIQRNFTPVAILNSSLDDAVISGIVNIIGTANGTGFQNYTVYYGSGIYPSSWIELNNSNSSISDGILTEWNTTNVSDGTYTIRLLLYDTNNQTTEDRIIVTVNNALDCGDTITINITLTENLTNCTGHGLIIGADNIILDCAGYVIDGSDIFNFHGVFNYGFDGVVVKNCVITDFDYGIYYGNSNNGSIINNIANSNSYGIHLDSSSNNNLTNNIAQNNAHWDFYSKNDYLNNNIINLTTQQNLISFVSKDIALKGLTLAQAPTDPTGYYNISKWINATNNSADSWLFINFSYSDSDVTNLNESSLRVWKWNGSWTNETFYTNSGIDITNNYVYVNITNFASIFAPLGLNIPPIITLVSPANETYDPDGVVVFVCNATDDVALDSVTLYLWNSTGLYLTNTTEISGTVNETSWPHSLTDEVYTWNCRVNDSINWQDWADANYTLTIDTTYPLISYDIGTENNDTIFSRNWIYVNVSVTEQNEANITFRLYNSTSAVNITTFTTPQRTINWTDLNDGIYYYNVTITDLASNDNSTATRVITLDLTQPNITSANLFPLLLLSGEDLVITANVTDNTGVSQVWYNMSNSSWFGIGFMNGTGGVYNASYNTGNLGLGVYGVRVFANDSVGNEVNMSLGEFELVKPVNLILNILDYQNNISWVSGIEIFYNGTSLVRNKSTENVSNVSYGLPQGYWDIRIWLDEFNITLFNVNLTDDVNTSVSIDSPNITLTIDHAEFRKTAVLETGLDFIWGELVIPYNESGLDESRLVVYACHNWSLLNRTCLGNWVNITGNSSIDTANNKVIINTSNLSSFSLAEITAYCGDGNVDSGEDCVTCPQDAGCSEGYTCNIETHTCEVVSGIGGRIETGEIRIMNYPDQIQIKQGGTGEFNITVNNTGKLNLTNVIVSVVADCCEITITPNNISLLTGETREFRVLVSVLVNQTLGTYVLTVKVNTAQGASHQITTDLVVTAREALVCQEGETRSCGQTDVGICKFGVQTCLNNQWSDCVGEVKPLTEICDNGLDDDCDGFTDGKDIDCAAVIDTCSNGIRDGDEEGVDCGGSCSPCPGFPWLVLIITGVGILVVLVLVLYLRSKGKELTWEELERRWRKT